jgi:hypothetical protein
VRRRAVGACAPSATLERELRPYSLEQSDLPLKLPASIKAAATRLVREDGVSLNQLIATAVAQKVGEAGTAAEFFRRRAGDATGESLCAILDRVSDAPPEPGDELPADREQSSSLRSETARVTATGGCQCGAARYELTAEPLHAHVCHCRECQKRSASGVSVVVPREVDIL